MGGKASKWVNNSQELSLTHFQKVIKRNIYAFIKK